MQRSSVFGESPILAGLVILALLVIAGWGGHPLAIAGLICQAAAVLLAAPRVVLAFARGAEEIDMTAKAMAPVKRLVRGFFLAGVATVIAALAIILIGSSSELPARLGFAGLALAIVAGFFYLLFLIVRITLGGRVRRSSLDRRLSDRVTARLGPDFAPMLGFFLLLQGFGLELIARR